MTEAPVVPAGFEAVVAELEKTIAKLAEGTAPLDELVTAHGKAVRLLAEARSRLALFEESAAQIARLLE